MTKVPPANHGAVSNLTLRIVLCALFAVPGFAQSPPQKPAETLYLQLGQAGLDPSRVYRVRDASLNRSAVHLTLEDGTIAFTQDVMGRITGAFFEGEGEVLLSPPNEVERRSMGLFTGMAILEEHFVTAYFRFNDDLLTELKPDLRASDNRQEFVDKWNKTAQNLAANDAMRLLLSFSASLPTSGPSPAASASPPESPADRFFRARLQGTKLGVFDVTYDSLATEQVQAGQGRTADNGVTYYDVWTSFSPAIDTAPGSGQPPPAQAETTKDWLSIRDFQIDAEVQPPRQIHARARLHVDVHESGSRILLFELSRFLQIESVTLNGNPVEFIHNPAVEGTQLSFRGNDLVAVVLPQPAQAGNALNLEFVYGGEVLAEAGGGLLYVGARGTWYPNRGLVMANFDLRFKYPQGWTLVATGKPADTPQEQSGMQSSRWVSERPIPVAGFNLGKYKEAKIQAGNVTVETYATQVVERDFPNPPIQPIEPSPPTDIRRPPRISVVPQRPSPAQNEMTVGQAAARAITYYSERFGPYPYSQLALTQMPGRESQGWPGLIFLSSYAFLGSAEREQLHLQPYQIALQKSLPAHETAHQWWGDLIVWRGYRDQWLSEGLANYSAMMMLQEKDPAAFRQIMDRYRKDLGEVNKDGIAPKDAGPVTLGLRLLSSRFPQGYEAISYGRATWLFHMLRSMLRDAQVQANGDRRPAPTDELFVRGLRKMRERYEGKSITTVQLLDLFAEDLPPALRYEGKKSLDWFLGGWVNGTALPKLELKSVKITPKGTSAVVTGTILQKDAPQDLVTSVPLYAVVPGRPPAFIARVFADEEESTFRISAPAGTRKILLDPDQTVLTAPK